MTISQGNSNGTRLFDWLTSKFNRWFNRLPTTELLEHAKTTEDYTMFDTYKKDVVSTEESGPYLEEGGMVYKAGFLPSGCAMIISTVVIQSIYHVRSTLTYAIVDALAVLSLGFIFNFFAWMFTSIVAKSNMRKAMKQAELQGHPVIYTPTWLSRPSDIWLVVGLLLAAIFIYGWR